jgi:hypothetical protein
MPSAKPTPTTEQQIRTRAHDIWQREGCPHGRHLDHWHQAEAEIAAETASATPRARPAAPANRNRRKAAAAE